MLEWIKIIAWWLAVAIALSPVVIGIGWVVWEGSILPRLVPREEIEAMAEKMLRERPDDPEEWAFMEEHAAWYRSHSFEQGKWHRVRKLIRKRLLAGH